MFLPFQRENIITLYDVSNIWRVPLLLRVCIIAPSHDACFELYSLLTQVLLFFDFRIRRLMRQFWKSWTSTGSSSYHCVLHLWFFAARKFSEFFPVFVLDSLDTLSSENRVPALVDWTARADLSDRLTDTVRSHHYSNFDFKWSSGLRGFEYHTFFFHRSELLWLESTPCFQMLIFLCWRYGHSLV